MMAPHYMNVINSVVNRLAGYCHSYIHAVRTFSTARMQTSSSGDLSRQIATSVSGARPNRRRSHSARSSARSFSSRYVSASPGQRHHK
jgi:hypothetical protein